MKRIGAGLVIVLLAALGWVAYRFESSDLETKSLTMEERRLAKAGGEYLQTFDGVVHYQLAGPADADHTVVLVHGFSVPYYLWDGTFEALVKAGHRVLRYDLFGRGYSDRVPHLYNGELFDRQLVELLNALRIKGKVDLVGASMGGPIAAGFACRHADRTRSLMLIGPGYSTGGALPWRIMTPVIGEYLFATETAPRLPEGQMSDFKHPERFPDWSSRYLVQMQYQGFRHALLSTLRHYVTSDWSAEYACAAKTGVPSYLIWGKHDKDVPVTLSEEFKKLMPKAGFMVVDDTAHVPFLERPDIVHPVMVQFLNSAEP